MTLLPNTCARAADAGVACGGDRRATSRRRRTVLAGVLLAGVSVLVTAAPAFATHTREHTCATTTLGVESRFVAADSPSNRFGEDICLITEATRTTVRAWGAPTEATSDPTPVGDPVVVTELVVANCEQLNDDSSASTVERCDIREVTTTTQQTEVITTTTQRMLETSLTSITAYPYYSESTRLDGLRSEPWDTLFTSQEVAPVITTSTATGPPIVDISFETIGTCVNNPGSEARGNACPV